MATELQIILLRDALQKILDKASPGNMAFIRCLESQVVKELCASSIFTIPEWSVFGVTGQSVKDKRFIAADHAVELRENKKDSVLLLVDIEHAGAGMDGIYSATREIGEAELFVTANELARKKIQHGFQIFAKNAVKEARRIGRQNTISPWREFEFLTCCSDKEEICLSLAILGLWPIKIEQKPEGSDLDKSVSMVERLFLQLCSNTTIESKIDALMLIDPTDEQFKDLAKVLRSAANMSFFDAIAQVGKYPHLCLNNLRPGIFELDIIHKIEVISWRGKNQKPLSWSGLSEEDSRLQFILNPHSAGTRRQRKLEVRWKPLPENLKKGVVEYSVAVVSGDEELAEKKVTHTGKNPQKCIFVSDDFELEEGAKFEAVIQIKVVGNENISDKTEDFVLCFGEASSSARSGAGGEERALVEGAINLESREDFEEACRKYTDPQHYGRDTKGFITFRYQNKRAKVFCPELLRDIDSDWGTRKEQIGRWKIKVRNDGTRIGEHEFIPFSQSCSDDLWIRLLSASDAVSNMAVNGQCMMGFIHGFNKNIDEYINAWSPVLESGEPILTLANTIEVISLSGNTIGLIVLPFHPLRIAWHQAYDTLLQYARYEENIAPTKIREIMKTVDGSHFPAFLPGIEAGESFVFGDTLGFYAVAMISDKDREPKASIAILARVLSNKNKDIAPSIGKTTSDVLGDEIKSYLDLHSHYNLIHLHALRPGDGMTIGRALGSVVENNKKQVQKNEEMELEEREHVGFILELYPTSSTTGIVGKYLSLVAEERRTGAGRMVEQDRWMLENIPRKGNIQLPRLQWAKRDTQEPDNSAHLSVAFDTFDSQVMTETLQSNISAPIEAYGLIVSLIRTFSFTPQPVWRTFLSPVFEGEKHPAGRGYTDRLIRLHEAIMKATAQNIGGSSDSWPVLITELQSDKEESIRALHSLSDWVITIDRNAGMEYFDSPKEKSAIYDAYIIDCVPEREDLGFLQMVTSTSSFEEIVNLLDITLAEMGLSSSPRNCLFLLNELKGLSGRFAMRLAGSGKQSQEMIALALMHTYCSKKPGDNSHWLSLKEGFFIPLDDVSLLSNTGKKDIESEEDSDSTIADLLYVYAPPRSSLQFAFVEVKFRRYLRTSRGIDLIDTICKQIRNTRRRFEALYVSQTNLLERSVRRSSLARILKFYANRGHRHNLSEDAYQRIIKEIDKMVREGEKYDLSSLYEQDKLDKGYIFCPEFKASTPATISFDDQPQIVLFGATQIPDPPSRVVSLYPPEEQHQEQQKNIKQDNQKGTFEPIISSVKKEESASHKEIMMDLGNENISDEPVSWNISISSNPHLMIVGLPGMGKTTCLINICLQMVKHNIVPIVFSYHDDIDTKIIDKLGSDMLFVDYAGLGFSPLEVVGDSAIAYIDNVGMLRDIFSSIFPEIGEVQLGRLREAFKQSYVDHGWADSGRNRNELQLPSFQAFYDILKAQPKPEKNLLTRLAELDDYDFFRNTSGAKSLLDSNKPAIIRIHKTQNEVLQRAFATFVLHNLYQRMFQRGVQNKITHAIIFDEAHRAAKLKLLPGMVKECRKYGITFVVASQEAKDFDPSLFSAIGNYLVLRLTENDAKVLAKIMAASDQINRYTDKIKQMPKYHALFFGEGRSRVTYLALKEQKQNWLTQL